MAVGADERFEKRIEEYKANGYQIKNRDGDTVVMLSKKAKLSADWWLYLIFAILSFIGIVFFNSIIFYISAFFFAGFCGFTNYKNRKVNISLTKTGKIEETGNVL